MIDLDKFKYVMELVTEHGDCALDIRISAYEGVQYVLIQQDDTRIWNTIMFTDIDDLIQTLNKLISEK